MTLPQCANADGQLPSCAPLANPYVPFQQTGSEQYPAPKALVRGTIFPGLDLPFMGMVNSKEKTGTALVQVQELGFALRELGLYLDTHAGDAEAFAAYQDLLRLAEEGAQRYAKLYGPITKRDLLNAETYTWLKSPWPWEYRGGTEG